MRESIVLQHGWHVSIDREEAARAARVLPPCGNAPVEKIDLPGGPQYGKRPQSAGALQAPAAVTEAYVGDLPAAAEEGLPNPFLSYARQVEIPASWAGKTVFLILDNARYHVTAWANGQRVAHYVGGLEPHRVDVTEQIRAGETALLEVTVGDSGVSGHRVFDAYNYTGNRLPTCREIENNLVHPVHYGGADRAVGKVTLEALPRTRLDWIFANPKTSRGELLLSGRLVDESGADARKLRLQCEAIAEDGAVRALIDREVEMENGELRFQETIPWPNAVLWDTDHPHLYRLRTRLWRGDEMVDTHEEYFGFREFGINGHDFLLNGKKIHLQGQSGHIMAAHEALNLEEKIEFFRTWKERGNVNHMRLHGRPFDKSWVLAADRAGMLLTTETALWTTNFHSFDWAGSEEACYQNVCNHFMEALVRRDRNNPSVVIWSLSNEMAPISDEDMESPKMAAMTRVFERIIDLAQREDDSRVIQMSSALDFRGRLKMYNLHYPKNWQAYPDYPVTAYWIDEPFAFRWFGKNWRELPRWTWRKDKPLYFGEFTCVFGATPDNQAGIVGDVAFTEADNGSRLVQEKLWPLEVAAYRRRDVSGFCAWAAAFVGEESVQVESWMERSDVRALAYSMRPLAALCHSYRTQFLAGSEVTLELSLHNDTRLSHHLHFRVTAAREGEVFWHSEMPTARYGPAENKAFECRFIAPPVAGPTLVEIEATLWSDRAVVDRWTRTIEVHPREARCRLPQSFAVFDPDGRRQELARQRGISGGVFIEDVEALANLEHWKVLWLPCGDGGSRLSEWKRLKRVLCQWVASGGCLVLDKASDAMAGDLPVALQNAKGYAEGDRLEITYAYIAARHHPLLEGLTDDDFALWGEDYYVARHCWQLPEEGNVQGLLVAGTDRAGLINSPLLEMRHGAGNILVNSLEIWEKLQESPHCTTLLQRIASYEGARPFKDAAVSATATTLSRLREVGWQGGNVAPTDSLKKPLALIDGALLESNTLALAIEKARAGASVILHELSAEQCEALLNALQATGQVTDGAYQGISETLLHHSPVTDGVTNNNLYWTTGKERLAPWTPAQLHPQPATARVVSEDECCTALTSQSSVTMWRVGKGQLIVDNLRWGDAEMDEPQRARRYLVAVLTNLGFPLSTGVDKEEEQDFETEAERRERGHF
jgi:hypothetical protein